MKTQSTFIVIRNKKDGSYLVSYKNNPTTLAYSASWSDDIENAISVPVKYYERDKCRYKSMAKMAGGEIIKVQADYNLSYPNGSNAREIKPTKQDSPLLDLFKAFQAAKESEEY
ncbi:hypothetical protein HK253_02120 [Streptococcus agalactiae]|nr:hypothetical protein [Streptococcus agalactiae]